MRARSLKPSLFKNELLGAADPLYTLIFEGLWCAADRDGRLEDRPLRLHVEINPYRDSAGTVQALDWLGANNFIVRYEADGQRFIQIVNFLKHQQPHIKEAQSKIPVPHNQGVVQAPVQHGASTVQKPLTPDSGLLTADSPFPNGQEPRAKRSTATRLPDDFALTPERREVCESESLDPERTFAKFVNYWRSASGAKARKLDWDATWRNWCLTEGDRRPSYRKPEPVITWRPPPDGKPAT